MRWRHQNQIFSDQFNLKDLAVKASSSHWTAYWALLGLVPQSRFWCWYFYFFLLVNLSRLFSSTSAGAGENNSKTETLQIKNSLTQILERILNTGERRRRWAYSAAESRTEGPKQQGSFVRYSSPTLLYIGRLISILVSAVVVWDNRGLPACLSMIRAEDTDR